MKVTEKERTLLLPKFEKIKGYKSDMFDISEWAEFSMFCIGYNLSKAEVNGNETPDHDSLKAEVISKINEMEDCKEKYNYQFGATNNYKAGDIVVWCGANPCIGKIKGRGNGILPQAECWAINESHDSLHYSNLRYAKPEEIELLGDKDILLLNK